MSRPETPKTNPRTIQDEYDDILDYLDGANPSSNEYAQALDQLAKLHALMTTEKSSGIKPEAWLAAFVHLAGIAAILKHEQFNVITSKALGFVIKTKG